MRPASFKDAQVVLDTHTHSRWSYKVWVVTVSAARLGDDDDDDPEVASADVDAVEVICSEGGVALGALPLARVVARLDALEAEDVVALGQHGVLHPRVAAGAC